MSWGKRARMGRSSARVSGGQSGLTKVPSIPCARAVVALMGGSSASLVSPKIVEKRSKTLQLIITPATKHCRRVIAPGEDYARAPHFAQDDSNYLVMNF